MHKHAEILKALAEGKTIQYKNVHCDNVWRDMPYTTVGDVWNSLCLGKDTSFSFRVKPEKKKGWINIYPTNQCSEKVHATKEAATIADGAEWRIACIEIEYDEGQGL